MTRTTDRFQEEGEEWGEEYAAWHHKPGAEREAGHVEEGLLFQSLGEETSFSESESQDTTGSRAIDKAVRLCAALAANTHAACLKLINYVLKMSRKTMRRWGSRALTGSMILEDMPIPNAIASLIAKASAEYVQALGQAMLNAVKGPGKGRCFLSFHTFKLPLVGDTGVPDGVFVAGCGR